ncbi:MAG: hypothetical protein ABSG45_00060 [Nitrososphaerales archaeon]
MRLSTIGLAATALLAFAFSFLSNLFSFEFGFVILFAKAATSASNLMWLQITVLVTFVAAPCLLFLVFFFYGKTHRHLSDGYLRVALSLFIGSALGFVAAAYSVPFLRVGFTLNGDFGNQLDFGALSTGLVDAFLGISALTLSHVGVQHVEHEPRMRKRASALVVLLALGVFLGTPVVGVSIPGPINPCSLNPTCTPSYFHFTESLSCYLQGGGPEVWLGTYYSEGELNVGCSPLLF